MQATHCASAVAVHAPMYSPTAHGGETVPAVVHAWQAPSPAPVNPTAHDMQSVPAWLPVHAKLHVPAVVYSELFCGLLVQAVHDGLLVSVHGPSQWLPAAQAVQGAQVPSPSASWVPGRQ